MSRCVYVWRVFKILTRCSLSDQGLIHKKLKHTLRGSRRCFIPKFKKNTPDLHINNGTVLFTTDDMC